MEMKNILSLEALKSEFLDTIPQGIRDISKNVLDIHIQPAKNVTPFKDTLSIHNNLLKFIQYLIEHTAVSIRKRVKASGYVLGYNWQFQELTIDFEVIFNVDYKDGITSVVSWSHHLFVEKNR